MEWFLSKEKIQKYTLPDKSKATVLFCGYEHGNGEYEMTGDFKEEEWVIQT